MMGGYIPVVAGALVDENGRWLMHCRPLEKHHGGLWEFPGGKVEAEEIPGDALIRELCEELGIRVAREHCMPVAFAEETGGTGKKPIVILLYKVTDWEGEAAALEGGAIDWFTPEQIERLDKPPLDCELAKQLFDRS